MINDMKTLANKAEIVFDFLKTAYGFKKVSKDIDRDYFKISFKNKTTEISLNYELREQLFFIFIYKLTNNEILDDAQLKTKDKSLNSLDLQYIIQYSEGSNYLECFKQKYKNYPFEEVIQQYALDLVKYAKDILNGDFEKFNEVEKIANKRRLDWLAEQENNSK
jgi:hypothetical protein